MENGKYNKTPIIGPKTKIFCALSRIITGDNQFCRTRAITCKGLYLANEIICSCTLFSVKLEYFPYEKPVQDSESEHYKQTSILYTNENLVWIRCFLFSTTNLKGNATKFLDICPVLLPICTAAITIKGIITYSGIFLHEFWLPPLSLSL